MSGPETPLHVRVAIALGWTACRAPREGEKHGQWVGVSPRRGHWGADVVPRYDESWKHTGPLIERYGIGTARRSAAEWEASVHEGVLLMDQYAYAPTPLLAVCHLILALHAAGKLEVHGG